MDARFPPLRILRSLVVVAAVALASCSSPTAPPPPSGALKVSAILPNTGSPTAATPITIVGTGFQSGAKLTLGGVASDVRFISSTNLTATAPAHAEGPIDIVVTNPTGESSKLVAGFSYVAPPPPLTGLKLSGNLALASIGQTSQLTATAVFADGSTRDVSKESQWFVGLTGVATIASDGVVTARGLGATSFFVRYPPTGQSQFQDARITVTPPGTFAVNGWIREPGVGGVPGVRVVNTASGQSMLTMTDGEYTFGALTTGHFSVTKDGYEPGEFDAAVDSSDDTAIQRIMRITMGASLSASLAPNDMDYVMGPNQHCQPCHLIHVTTTAGTMHVKVAWTNAASVLNVWANGQSFLGTAGSLETSADVEVGTGEVILYVGKLTSAPTHVDGAAKVPFTLTTSLISPPQALSAGCPQSCSRQAP